MEEAAYHGGSRWAETEAARQATNASPRIRSILAASTQIDKSSTSDSMTRRRDGGRSRRAEKEEAWRGGTNPRAPIR